MTDDDPALSLATTDQFFAELERRFPDFVFAGHGTNGEDDGRGRFVLKTSASYDVLAGLVDRLQYVRDDRLQRQMDAAYHTEEDADDDE